MEAGKRSVSRETEAVIVDAVRTPVGRRNGSLSGWHPAALLADTLNGLVDRAGIPRDAVDDVIAGCATQVGDQAGNIGRTALLMAGFPVSVPGATVQRACGSSQQAVHFAANLIETGTCEVVVACGVESMSRTQGAADDPKYGRRYPEELVERFAMPTMGVAAERIAERWNLSRTYLDELSLRSHQLAAQAQDGGYFDSQMHPVTQPDGSVFRTDEGIRPGTSMEKLASLKVAFQEGGKVTAGNSSQISDGASAMLLMSRKKAAEYGLRPRARLRVQTVVGVDPEIMLTGPIPATAKALQMASMTIRDIDLFEINEAFAPILGSWLVDTKADLDRVNVNGGSIAMGHPLGSTGVRLMTILLNELERRDARFGLQSMCCGGGLGTATIIERLDG